MNIFVIGDNACPIISASHLCDRHVLKQGLEAVGMLNCALPESRRVWKVSHMNHPCSVWARTSLYNFLWLYEHGMAIFEEYTRRYGKVHKSVAALERCHEACVHIPFDTHGPTPFAQAMPDEYKDEDAVTAYRNYYMGEKQHLAQWRTSVPHWFEFRNN